MAHSLFWIDHCEQMSMGITAVIHAARLFPLTVPLCIWANAKGGDFDA